MPRGHFSSLEKVLRIIEPLRSSVKLTDHACRKIPTQNHIFVSLMGNFDRNDSELHENDSNERQSPQVR